MSGSKITLLIVTFFCIQLPGLVAAQDIKITVDLGGTEFEYLEFMFMKVYVENNSNRELIIESNENAPQFHVLIKNSKEDIFPSHIVYETSGLEKTIITIEPGASVYWPRGSGYFSLEKYFLNGKYDSFLPEDEYTLIIKLETNLGVIESDPFHFKVIGPINELAFKLYTEAFDIWRSTLSDVGYIERLEQIGKIAPKSVYNSLALFKLYGIYVWGHKQHEKREEMIDRMLYQMIENLPGNRFTEAWALLFLKFNSKRTDTEKKKILRNLLTKTTIPEVQRDIKSMLGLHVQKGFHIKSVKIERPPPPPEDWNN